MKNSYRILGTSLLTLGLVSGGAMGAGGVTALGCTLGQGVSGLSTLALGAIITTAAIVAGAAATMKFQYWLLTREP